MFRLDFLRDVLTLLRCFQTRLFWLPFISISISVWPGAVVGGPRGYLPG